jgi:hypothetical protein
VGLLREREEIEEVRKVQGYAGSASPGDLFATDKTRTGATQDETIYAAYVRHGDSMKEIADHLV